MAAISLEEVTAGYVPGVPALRALSLQVADGDFLAVIGPNGSGKTTLLRVMAGVLRPWRGTLRVRARAMSEWPRPQLARELAVVPQISLPPFAFTVREFVCLGRNPYLPPWASPRPSDIEAVERAMAAVEIDHLAERAVTELSGGEFQRAALARALAQEPSILLLDEPTAFLDPAHAVAILGLLEELNAGGLTIVAVLHDLNFAAAYARRVVALRDGRVFADGPTAQVMQQELLESLYETAVRVEEGPDGVRRVTLLKAGARR